MSYKSDLTTSRGNIRGDQFFAKQVSTPTVRKTENRNNPDAPRDTYTVKLFFEKVETSCKAIGHSATDVKHNKRLVFSMCTHPVMSIEIRVSGDDEEGSFIG